MVGGEGLFQIPVIFHVHCVWSVRGQCSGRCGQQGGPGGPLSWCSCRDNDEGQPVGL